MVFTAIALALSGIAAAAESADHRDLLRERMVMESLVAMTVPGTRLCREITWGIGNRDRIEAESLGVDHDVRRVTLRIMRLGQGPFVLYGREIRVGETLTDNPLDWVPCAQPQARP